MKESSSAEFAGQSEGSLPSGFHLGNC